MQAFFYRHLVPSHNLQIALAARGLPREVKVVSSTPIKIPVGGSARISVGLPLKRFDSRFDFELSSPPDGITIANVSAGESRADITIRTDGAKIKAGLQGNLILTAVTSRSNNSKTKNKNKNANVRFALGSLPAIPFEIVSNNESQP